MTAGAQRILLLSCSQAKRPDPGLLPAIQRYDGPAFRVLRRFLRGNATESLDLRILILSAAFGLCPADYPIPCYDFLMTPSRAKLLNQAVQERLQSILREEPYSELCICLGKTYLDALGDYTSLLPATTCLTIIGGPPGCKLSSLHDWLYGDQSPLRTMTASAVVTREIRLRKSTITHTKEQALGTIQQALQQREQGDITMEEQGHVWYTVVEGQQVGVKWAVNALTGMPRGAFGGVEARRVLTQLGFEVHRS